MTTEPLFYHALALQHCGSYLKLKKFFEQYGSWEASWMHSRHAADSTPEAAWESLVRTDIRLIVKNDPEFPSLLREIPWAPHALYARGAPIGDEPKLAIVGTRRASPAGIHAARSITKELVSASFTIVSGLAFGIDAAAHQETLSSGGKAIVVLAGGLNEITPRSNAHLGEKLLASGGTLLSEYPPGISPLPRHFLERNRIISGLCLGVIVVEAPARSGTLATARFAIEQNRDVFVVPGPITHVNYAGSHALIQSGASLITSGQDVLRAQNTLPLSDADNTHTQVLPFLDKQEQRIVELLRRADKPLSVDALAEQAMLGITILNEILAQLIIGGYIKEGAAGYFV